MIRGFLNGMGIERFWESDDFLISEGVGIGMGERDEEERRGRDTSEEMKCGKSVTEFSREKRVGKLEKRADQDAYWGPD